MSSQNPRGSSRGKGKGRAPKSGSASRNKSSAKPSRARGQGPFEKERFGRNLGPRKQQQRPAAQEAEQSFSEVHDPEGVRLQKVMAQAGVASRRVCEELIAEGRVEVDGKIVIEPGVRVNPDKVTIHVDGMRVQLNKQLRYYAFNKPRGVVSTMEDPEGRPCITDYLKNKHERLFHVGRLDTNTEGLLLLTNDGELANRLTHPKWEVPKTYLVQVPGPLPKGVGAQLRAGIELEDGISRVDSFKVVDSTPGYVLIEVVLHSGKNRIVRRMFSAVGHPVRRLVRLQMGSIRLGDQKQGTIRPLSQHEIGHLLAEVGL